MTTEQPTEQPTVQRALRRRTDDRVIAGVASGLADYFSVDPLLIRIGLVGLMVFNGVGLILYLAGWLLVPTDTGGRSTVQRLIGRTGLTARGFLLAGLLIIGAYLFVRGVSGPGESGFAAAVGAAIVIIVGAMVLRRGERDASVASPASADEPAVATPAVPRERPVRPRRARSPLSGYVAGATLVALGLLSLVVSISGGEVDLGQFFGLALGVMGIGLLIGAWWGDARPLIVLGLLVLPFAIAASFITAPIEGEFGSHRFSPTDPQELEDEYRLVGGRLVLDLTEFEGGAESAAITASVAMGELVVVLPADAGVQLDASVGQGELRVLDARQTGTGIEDRQVIEGEGQQFELDLEAGIGEIRIETAPPEER